MPLCDTATAIDAAHKHYLIDRESTLMGGLSQETMDKEERMMANIVSSVETAKRLGTDIHLTQEEHKVYLSHINAA
jgi:hypothetical protein